MEIVRIKLESGFSFNDLDRKKVKSTMRSIGRDLRKEARKRISRKAISAPGESPGMQTGEMRRSVKASVSRSGYSVWVRPTLTNKMPAYYPAFVVFGHRGPGSDDPRQHGKTRVGQKVAEPRENFIEATAKAYQKQFDEQMENLLSEALK